VGKGGGGGEVMGTTGPPPGYAPERGSK